MNVAQLASTVGKEVPKQKSAPQPADPFAQSAEQEEQEMDQAASLGIVDQKYAGNK